MYPIRFQNLYYDKIWGGRDFEDFRRNLPKGNIGESWDVACHKNGMGIVANGSLKRKRFDEIVKEYGHSLVGTDVSTEKFPLLLKLINSEENLSVQVHPGDEYAKKYANEYGKTEAWYVIDAKPGAKLIIGTKDCSKEEFEKAIKEGKCEEYLNIIEVKKGDSFLINSGLVHAIGGGLTIAEIQQNSDITYRVYDYGRKRELHVDQSLQVINFDLKAINCSENAVEDFEGFSKVLLCENEYFGMEKYNIKKELNDESDEKRFFIITCVEGNGGIIFKNSKEKIKKGDSYLIPATLGKYSIKGQLEIIKSYPN
ncbi:type I phosphomannose isomerase catalytic subunit [Clostridium algidicarnis]|uniref:type I phosphomannose isomerase catalytic subunit n=1 Tax=Clostridium algidicarnis TaxID=37659 RepID=UPI001C0E84FB|nr:type I phosphomannose isomerase catalytic subunit [Clostridium algidicarnis]MBU3227352.1 class I mannose-6-phosphate isomerase [Clostridium algidicarnis]MBU3250875.1 class I mannose-6-phosphate isomerase [Clostridium algidicarnis]